MKKQTSFKLISLLLAMLMLLATFAGCTSDAENAKKAQEKTTDQPFSPNTDPDAEEDSRPQAVVRNSLLQFAKGLSERDGIEPLVNATQKGSLELQLDFDAEEMYQALYDEVYTGEQADLLIGGKFFFAENAFFMKDLALSISVPFENIDIDLSADLYCSHDYAYLASEEMFSGAYGIIRGEMAEKFANSALVANSDMPADVYDLFYALLCAYDEGKLNDYTEEATKILGKYLTKLGSSIEKNAKYVTENKKVMVAGEAIDSRVITVTVDEKALLAILDELYAEIEDDKELRELVIECLDYLASFVAPEEVGNNEAIWDELLDALDEAMDEIETEMEPGAFILEIVTPKKKSVLRKLSFSVESDGEAEKLLALDVGKDGIKTTNRIELLMVDDVLIYEITENSADAYKACVKVVSNIDDSSATAEIPFFSIENDRKNNTFVFTGYNTDPSESAIVFAGTYTVEKGRTEIIVNSITYDGETLDGGFALKLVIDEDDPITGVLRKDQVTNILDFTEADSQRITENLERIFGDLLADASPEKTQPTVENAA